MVLTFQGVWLSVKTEALESVHGCGWCGITSSAKAVCAGVAVLVLRQHEIRAFHALIKKDQRKRPLTVCGIPGRQFSMAMNEKGVDPLLTAVFKSM